MSSDIIELLQVEECELRNGEGRTIIGRLAAFGEVAQGPKGPEIVSPGSIDTTVRYPLVDGHHLDDIGRPVVGPVIGTLEVREEHDGYWMTATANDDDYSRNRYRELRNQIKDRLSIGFKALKDPIVDGVRRLDKLALGHVALVPAGAYPSAAVTEVRTKGEAMEEATEAVETPDTPVVETADPATDELRALREDIAEMNRKVAAQQVVVTDSPEAPWSPLEVRTAGEWLFHAARATRSFDWVTPTEQALSLEKLGGNLDEIRAVTSTPASGLGAAIPDQYLGPIEDLYKAGRPFINALGSQPLPSAGIDIHRPVVTQGSLVAWESTEGDEPTSQAVTMSDVVGALKALKSAMKATMQTALRSSPSAVDAMLRDQAAAMGTELDNAAINGTGTITTATGSLAGVLANGSIVTGTAIDTSYTSTKLMLSLTNAFVSILTAAPGVSMSEIFITMAPRRWGDTLALEDGSNRPIFNVSDDPAQNTLGDGTPVAGSIMRVPVVVDDNIPENLGVGTDQDNIIVCSRRSFELFEGSRMAASWQDPATFQTTYGSAVLAALLPIYPGALVSITGTGLK